MKHIVTLSLVFFSLTHLAHAERVEGLRLLTEGYCNKQINTESVNLAATRLQNERSPFFLSANELTLIGTLPEIKLPKYSIYNHVIADLTIRKKPKNNSP